jgi:hypothetical protein
MELPGRPGRACTGARIHHKTMTGWSQAEFESLDGSMVGPQVRQELAIRSLIRWMGFGFWPRVIRDYRQGKARRCETVGVTGGSRHGACPQVC